MKEGKKTGVEVTTFIPVKIKTKTIFKDSIIMYIIFLLPQRKQVQNCFPHYCFINLL